MYYDKSSAFYNCTNLSTVTIGQDSKLKSIGLNAFEFTAVNEVVIPKECASVGTNAFSYIDELEKVYFYGNPTLDKSFAISSRTNPLILYGYDSNTNAKSYAASSSKKVYFQVYSDKLEITSMPEIKYTYGDKLSTSELEITATYKSGATAASGEAPVDSCIISEPNMKKVGAQTITIEYGGVKTSYSIYVRYNLSNATVTVESGSVYTGKALTPNVTAVKIKISSSKSETLTASQLAALDVDYKNNINAGTATVTISGDGISTTGTKDQTFSIAKKALSAEDVTATVTPNPETYSGSEKTPDIALEYNDMTVDSANYTVTYGSNTNASSGEAYANVVAKSSSTNYTGSKKVYFDINSLDLASAEATAEIADVTYTGSNVVPQTIKVTRPPLVEGTDDITLTKDTDYTISGYKDNVNAGTATVTIAGKGNYKGTIDGTYNIVAVSMDAASVKVSDIEGAQYTGAGIKPSISVTFDKTTSNGTEKVALKENEDYTVAITASADASADASVDASADASGNPVSIGTYVVTITGMGNFKGSVEKTFRIRGVDISDAVVSADANVAYTGEAIEPEVEVTLGDTVLKKGTDYLVAYEDNIDAGTATITVNGIGNYEGTVTKTFAITKPLFEEGASGNAVINPIANQTFTPYGCEPTVSVTKEDAALVAGTDYTISYSNNYAVGTATATITGIGKYSGTMSTTFAIVPCDIDDCDVELEKTSFTYTGAAITPSVKVYYDDDEDEQLDYDEDYEVTYSNNVNAGTATVTINGIGNYSGTTTRTFTIVEAAVENPVQNVTSAVVTPTPSASVVEDQDTLEEVEEPDVAKVKKVKVTAKKKSFTITWKKLSGITKYQIQVSAKKTFKGAKTYTVNKSKTKYTVSKLTCKTKYFVRIRAYQTYVDENGKTQKAYGDWTTVSKKTK